jgi:hydroxymethylglutaryl-CoA reductase (NADPH)
MVENNFILFDLAIWIKNGYEKNYCSVMCDHAYHRNLFHSHVSNGNISDTVFIKERNTMSLKDFSTIDERRKFIEEETGQSLDAMGMYPEQIKIAASKNCENMIGVVQIPVGIAGPIHVKGDHAAGEYFLPLATTEGALVASVNRGCKAITSAGGAIVQTHNAGMSRGCVFTIDGIRQGRDASLFIKTHQEKLNQIAQTTSTHLILKSIQTKLLGKNLFVRFVYDTQDAMGMNMVTIATQEIAAYLQQEAQIQLVSLAGNFDVDKKPSWLNILEGRGRQVWAEATITKEILQNILKTTAETLHEVCLKKCLLGSIVSGSMGFNAHFANIVAALFIATGQDPAHVSEGSTGFTTTEVNNGELYIAVHLPDLPLGTIGGGTSLPAQQEAFSILGIKQGSAELFAEIIGAAILAGELSLLASLASGSLARSHQHLARGK